MANGPPERRSPAGTGLRGQREGKDDSNDSTPAAAVCKARPTAPAGMLQEAAEHRGERRRFLVWALMLGAVEPERVTERIVDELRREGKA